MKASRVRDWLVGALGMLVALVLGLGVAWWTLTAPSEVGGRPAGAPGSGRPADSPTRPADLGDEEIWLADLDLDAVAVVLPDSTLGDVRATGQGVRSGPGGLMADRLAVAATVPFAEIAAELGGDTQVRAAEGGQATVVRTVEVLGRDLAVVATGTVEVENGLLVVEPRTVDLGGPDVLSRATAAMVRQLVTIEHAIEGLPEGLVLQRVDVREDGFRAHLEGRR